uniref:Uncharacterized protein n=1 Tax=Romanomermis culicivorax TaxID=13658 RepID=A0A915KDH8_ROMCU
MIGIDVDVGTSDHQSIDEIFPIQSLRITLLNYFKIIDIDFMFSTTAAFAETPPVASIITKWMEYRDHEINFDYLEVKKHDLIMRDSARYNTKPELILANFLPGVSIMTAPKTVIQIKFLYMPTAITLEYVYC